MILALDQFHHQRARPVVSRFRRTFSRHVLQPVDLRDVRRVQRDRHEGVGDAPQRLEPLIGPQRSRSPAFVTTGGFTSRRWGAGARR